jgi:hypothetical protein
MSDFAFANYLYLYGDVSVVCNRRHHRQAQTRVLTSSPTIAHFPTAEITLPLFGSVAGVIPG